jgi:hypothetical protein
MKRLTVAAAAAMALGLAACGDDVKERTVVVQPTPAPTAAPSTTVVNPPANNNATPAPTQNNTVVVPERRP